MADSGSAGTFVGILVGVTSTLLAQYWTRRNAREAEQRQLRREKLEQLAELIISAPDWIERFKDDYFAVPHRYTPGEPMDRIYMLTEIYFPEIRQQAEQFCGSARAYCTSVRMEALRTISGRLPGRTLSETEKAEIQKIELEYDVILDEQNDRMRADQQALIAALSAVVKKLRTDQTAAR